jgi:hypothetical protein
MRIYRCYFLDWKDRIVNVALVEGRDDADACKRAKRLLDRSNSPAIELWELARRVFKHARNNGTEITADRVKADRAKADREKSGPTRGDGTVGPEATSLARPSWSHHEQTGFAAGGSWPLLISGPRLPVALLADTECPAALRPQSARR